MKRIFFASAFLMLMGTGCMSASSSTSSDFTPPTEGAENPILGTAGERRLLFATSTDGKTFTPTGTLLTEQGNVPDAVRTNEGTIVVYYVGQGIDGAEDTGAIAISEDEGKTWTYHLMQYENWPVDKAVSDPDVVLRDDGTFRMYFTMPLLGEGKDAIGIGYADSVDGITFTYKGKAFAPGFTVIDSTTFFADGKWHMFVLDFTKPQQYEAISTDGATFTLVSKTPIAVPGEYIISNPITTADGVRMFGFRSVGDPMKYFTSRDFATWSAGGKAMDANTASMLGGTYVQDMTVVERADGTYLMVYVANYGD